MGPRVLLTAILAVLGHAQSAGHRICVDEVLRGGFVGSIGMGSACQDHVLNAANDELIEDLRRIYATPQYPEENRVIYIKIIFSSPKS